MKTYEIYYENKAGEAFGHFQVVAKNIREAKSIGVREKRLNNYKGKTFCHEIKD